MTAHWQNERARCTILGKRVPREQSKGLGCLVSNVANEVLHYAEKPETFVSDIINCGVYVFSPAVFDLLAETYANIQRYPAR